MNRIANSCRTFFLLSFLHFTLQAQVPVNSTNDFAFRLYQTSKPDSANYVVSPFSLHMALAIIAEGAQNSTRQQMDKLLAMPSMHDRKDYYEFTSKMMEEDRDNCLDEETESSIKIANSVWVNKNLKVKEAYIERIKKQFHAETFPWGEKNSQEAMKKWIMQKTDNKITEIYEPKSDAMLNIVNAITFTGIWHISFDEKKTKKNKFHTLDKHTMDIDFMHGRNYYRYFEDRDLQAILLPYTCDRFSMVVFLPHKKYDLPMVEKLIDSTYLNSITQSPSVEVIISMPKFRIETELFPKEVLSKMRCSEMFTDQADFKGISDADRIKVDQIIHKTFIEVSEEKTEAAAYSLAEMVIVGYGGGDTQPPPPPKVFNANHPFMFMIVDNHTKAVLFMGRYVK